MNIPLPPPIYRPLLLGAGAALAAGLLCGVGLHSAVAEIVGRPRPAWQLESPRTPGAFEAWQPTEAAPPYPGRWEPPQSSTLDLAEMDARTQAMLKDEPPSAQIVQTKLAEGDAAELPDGLPTYVPSEQGDILAPAPDEGAPERVRVMWDAGPPQDSPQPYAPRAYERPVYEPPAYEGPAYSAPAQRRQAYDSPAYAGSRVYPPQYVPPQYEAQPYRAPSYQDAEGYRPGYW